MCRVSDNRLVQIPDLDGYASVYAGNRTKVTDMTIAADPDRRPFRQAAAFLLIQPFVKFNRAPANVSVGGSGHLEGLSKPQNRDAVVRTHRLS